MTLTDARQLAIELMTEHNLIAMGWKFNFNNRTSSFGLCNYMKKTIFLSNILAPLSKADSVKNTILHEIAHALCPREGHNHVWRAKFISIGGNGQRTGGNHYFEDVIESRNTLVSIAKYSLVCRTCNKISPRTRRPKLLISCGVCCPKFNREFLLELVVN